MSLIELTVGQVQVLIWFGIGVGYVSGLVTGWFVWGRK